MSEDKYNPQLVSPKVMGMLKPADREGVVFCQQAYVPLSGALLSAIQEAERRANAHSVRARG